MQSNIPRQDNFFEQILAELYDRDAGQASMTVSSANAANDADIYLDGSNAGTTPFSNGLVVTLIAGFAGLAIALSAGISLVSAVGAGVVLTAIALPSWALDNGDGRSFAAALAASIATAGVFYALPAPLAAMVGLLLVATVLWMTTRTQQTSDGLSQ